MVASLLNPPRMPTPSDSLWSRLCYTSLGETLRGNIAGELDARRVITSFNLGETLSAVVWQIVDKTRLWRSEKVDVARELASHFREGLDAGESAQQLIENFGDRVTAVKLIRRAKLRSRAWPYHAWQWTCRGIMLVVTSFLLLYGAQFWWLYSAKPVIRENYYAALQSQIEKTAVEDRAWPIYRQALAKMKVDPQENYDSVYSSAINATIGLPNEKDRWPSTEAYVVENREAIALIRQGAEKKLLGFTTNDPEDKPMDLAIDSHVAEAINQYANNVRTNQGIFRVYNIPTHIGMRRLRQLLSIDTCVAIREQDSARFTADVQALMGITQHSNNSLLDASKASLIYFEGDSLVGHALWNHPEMLTDADLQKLHLLFQRFDWKACAKSHGDFIDGQRKSVDDFLQRYYTDDDHGNGRITAAGLPFLDTYRRPNDQSATWWNQQFKLLEPVRASTIASREQVHELSEAILTKFAAFYAIPPWEQSDHKPELIALLQKLQQPRYRPLKAVLHVDGPDFVGIDQLTPPARGVSIGICLELFKREHGRWPHSLDELIPQYTADLLLDWATGKPLGYKLTVDGPLVYTVGANGKDDGGRLEPDANAGGALYDFPVWPIGGRFSKN